MRFRLRCWSWVHVSKIRKEMPRDRLTRERATGTISFHVLTDAVCGRVAQLVEQRTENPRAEGSSPPPTTTVIIRQSMTGCLFLYDGKVATQ